MLPLQFIGQNLHFAVSLLAALVFFAVFWLYFDAWTNKQRSGDLLKWSGFLLLSLSFVAQATIVEQSVLGKSLLGNLSDYLTISLRLIGYIVVIAGLILDPLQDKPTSKALEEDFKKPAEELPEKDAAAPVEEKKLMQAIVPLSGPIKLGAWLLPLGALAIAILYLRRATTGLERHLRPVAIAFFVFFVYELLSLARLLRDTGNPELFDLVKAFGPVWIAAYAVLLVGIAVLGRWVWRYLTERFLSQLFMIFTTVTLVIFLLTTISFTFLLMRNVQDQTLTNLETGANVLSYAIDSKKAETRANAELVALSPEVAKATASKDRVALQSLTSDFLETKKQSSLIIVSSSGQVLLRAEDPDSWGDSLSSDTTIQRALIGTASSSISSKAGVLSPIIYIKTAVPIRDTGDLVVGAAIVSLAIDNAFVDGIKSSTGLDSAVYSDNVRSATTFIAPDGKSRWVGVKEENSDVKSRVLRNGKSFKGPLNILNRSYLAVYAPLKDANNSVVGMLFIGQPQAANLQTASRSIELTFLVTAALLVLSIVPAYLMSRYLSRQLS